MSKVKTATQAYLENEDLENKIKYVQGKILTILEAVISQEDGGIKLEATKSIIKQELATLYPNK